VWRHHTGQYAEPHLRSPILPTGVNHFVTRSVNKIIGNATRDAELRHTQTGKAVSSLRLATNRQIKGEEETQFHSIVC
jgi:hypothetical protein